MEEPFVRTVELSNPAQLIEALSPTGQYLKSTYPTEWFFRGQADAAKPLLPTVLRQDPAPLLFDPEVGWSRHLRETSPALVLGEVFTIARFFWAADQYGLALPEDSQAIRAYLLSSGRPGWMQGAVAVWPPPEHLSLLALAQHYGIATRLLDWTFDPLHAAYFAVQGAAAAIADDRRTTKPARQVVVWAFHEAAYSTVFHVPAGTPRNIVYQEFQPATLVTAPTAGNPNLGAQRGVFLLGRWPFPQDRVVRTPLDELIEDGINRYLKMEHGENRPAAPVLPLFVKFLLPSDAAPEALRLLAQHGVTGGSLFPGFQGVARALQEEGTWDLRRCAPRRC